MTIDDLNDDNAANLRLAAERERAATPANTRRGDQRHTLDRLAAFEALGYGMFIHFGMSTYDGDEFSPGAATPSDYTPDALDVDQWVQVAADAGMRYVVLTAKHVAGFCLWPSDLTDYHVGNQASGNQTDVVESFVAACERHGLATGLYYCSWDNHHQFGSVTPTYQGTDQSPFTTPEYQDFQHAQLAEITERYGTFTEYWIDIPIILGPVGRREQYDQLASLAPDAVITMNSGFGPARYSNRLHVDQSWPTDVLVIERAVPKSTGFRYDPWQHFDFSTSEGGDFYLPGEVCDPIGSQWFGYDHDQPRSRRELLGMRLLCKERGVNLLLNVGPSHRGVIEARYVEALATLAKDLDAVDTRLESGV